MLELADLDRARKALEGAIYEVALPLLADALGAPGARCSSQAREPR